MAAVTNTVLGVNLGFILVPGVNARNTTVTAFTDCFVMFLVETISTGGCVPFGTGTICMVVGAIIILVRYTFVVFSLPFGCVIRIITMLVLVILGFGFI